MMFKLNPSRVRAAVGLFLSLSLLLIQATDFGRARVAEFRRPMLQFLSQADGWLGWVGQPRIWLENKNDLQRELMTCEIRNRYLEASAAAVFALSRENADLKASLGAIEKRHDWTLAALLSTENQLFIDVGSREGIKNGAIVLADGAYLGVVVDVQTGLSSLNSIFDTQLRLGAKIEPKGTPGILTRQGNQLLLTTISRDEEIKVGDTVVTLGDPRVRQGGIVIGQVVSLLTRPADPVSKFAVKPLLEKNQIQTVLVSKE